MSNTATDGNTDAVVGSGISTGGDIDLAYEDWGDAGASPILLIMGVGGQMLLWPDGFCGALVEAGFRVIRFDNRDVGLSGKTTESSRLPRWLLMIRAQLGLRSAVPYSLVDMAKDAILLLDHLQIRKAHIVGASMGGMIAQVLAAEYPERINSLTILFSSTNQPLLPPPAPSLLLKLLRRPSPQASKVQLMDQQKSLLRAIGSQTYPMEESELDALVERLYERSADTGGTQRQMAALLGTGDLRRYSRRIAAATLVIHGLDDRLIPPACGKAVARVIPNAALELIPDMAHDLPRRLWPRLINLLTWQANGRFLPSEHSQ